MKVVLDASAALAAILGHASGRPVLDALDSASTVLAPDLFVAEVTNGLWKYVSAGQISIDDAVDRLDAAMRLVDRLHPSADLATEALRESVRNRHPVYDLCYAVLARREGAAVLTLDARLGKLLVSMGLTAIL